ncbi:hypothetical protein GCM10023090_02780 [Acidovorax lacteus]|uniref:Tetratricopeptide repeat protein n=2 Tax=Acidovorax lacteus TaxID=1924988 RepID=A0ABP8KXJ7_9BURK
MSLIHDALRDMDTGAQKSPVGSVPPAMRAPEPRAGGRSYSDWLGGVAAFGVVVAAGVGGWMLLGPGAASKAPTSLAVPPAAVGPAAAPLAPAPSPAARPATAPAVAASASTPPVAVTAAMPTATAAPPGVAHATPSMAAGVTPVAAAPAAPSVAPASPAATERPRPPAGAANPVARAPRKAVASAPATPAPAPEAVDDKPVEQRFAEFMVAMNAQDWSGAQQQLDALRKRLPPQAAGLLRAQAWFDLQRGELDSARQGYQQLLERLPGDEEAAINLASVLSRQGQGEAARQVLLQAVQIRPDAPRLRDALRRFTPEVRP